MKAFLTLCLKWRVVVLMTTLTVCVFGFRSAFSLPIDAVPDITNAQVQVLTNAAALGPIDIEQSITFPIEASMSGIPGINEIRSLSRYGISAVTIVFDEGTDLLRARQLVSERLMIARERLPPGASPELGPLSSGLGEVLQFELRTATPCAGSPDTDACHSAMELRTILETSVAYELRSVPGVVEVNSWGGELRTFEVQLFPERLRAFNLSISEVYRALEANNVATAGGRIVRGGEQMMIRGEGRIRDLEGLRSVAVTTRGEGIPVTIADLGTVGFAPMLRQGAVTRDGRGEITTGIVMMLIGANGRQVVHDVQARIDEISPSLPSGVSISVFYDRADLVGRTIRTVLTNLAEGALFVIGVLILLLGSWRGGIIVALAIPFSLLVAFIGMNAMGVSGNLMSLGAIDFGIVVDSSIIVVESAVVGLAAALQGQTRPLTYAEASSAVVESTLGIRKAAIFGEAIIVIVYLPILALAGIEGRMFRPMAITVLFALLGAFVASLTFVPILVATWMRNQGGSHETRIISWLSRVYPGMLRKAMMAPKFVLGALVVTLGFAILIGSQLGADFVPQLDEGGLVIEMRRLPGVSIEEAVEGGSQVERILQQFPEVGTVVTKTGRPEIGTDPMGLEQSDVYVELRPESEWQSGDSKEELIERLEARLSSALPGYGFAFSQPIEMRMSELISGTRSDVAITIYGDDLETLTSLSDGVQSALRSIDGAADVRGEQLTGLTTVEVTINPEAAGRYGVSSQDALDAVSALGGHRVGDIYEGQRRFQLQVRLPASVRDDLSAIQDLPVRGSSGLIPLGQVSTVSFRDSPVSINRESVRRRTVVELNVRGRDLGGFVEEARRQIRSRVTLPAGYRLEWGGQFENLEAATKRLAFVVPVALVLIFILLYLAFAEFKSALLIYLNVPFAAVGGVFALWIRGMPFSVSAAVGFIALFGVAVLNGVVLLTSIKQLKEKGLDTFDASEKAAESRLRAVVMTASVAALGFLPMALSSSAGAEVQKPLATVVIGGLVTATLLTLFVLPTAYNFFSKEKPT